MAESGAAGSKPAVVLLSGGLDSATVLALARSRGYRCHALSFAYGQRHEIELDAARAIAKALGCESHIVVSVDLASLAPSALTGTGEVPKRSSAEGIGSGPIPATYVPARNIIFLSLAAARAEAVGARDIFLGVNALDYSGYPDCRPEFLEAFQRALDLGTRTGVEEGPFTLHAPLIRMTKAEIIRQGTRLGLDYSLTRSCYDPDTEGRACGACDSCLLRKKGFREAGVRDPTSYR
jgi:7-cyano-7-deazaguanine synthase